MLETVVTEIAAPIFERLWKLGGAAISDIKKEYKRVGALNKRLAAVSRYYEEGYRSLHAWRGETAQRPDETEGLRVDLYSYLTLVDFRSSKI